MSDGKAWALRQTDDRRFPRRVHAYGGAVVFIALAAQIGAVEKAMRPRIQLGDKGMRGGISGQPAAPARRLEGIDQREIR